MLYHHQPQHPTKQRGKYGVDQLTGSESRRKIKDFSGEQRKLLVATSVKECSS